MSINLIPILFKAPLVLSTIMAGSTIYALFGDPNENLLFIKTKKQLSYWSSMFRWTLRLMQTASIMGTLASLVAYFLTG